MLEKDQRFKNLLFVLLDAVLLFAGFLLANYIRFNFVRYFEPGGAGPALTWAQDPRNILAGLATSTTIIPDQDLRRQFRTKTDGYTGGFNGYFGLTATRVAYEQGEPWLSALMEHLKGNFELCKALNDRHER